MSKTKGELEADWLVNAEGAQDASEYEAYTNCAIALRDWEDPRIAELERELAEQKRSAGRTALVVWTARVQRELAETKREVEHLGKRLSEQRERAKAAEARLAAVASEMREHVSRRHGISVWQSMVGKWAAALTAPAPVEPQKPALEYNRRTGIGYPPGFVTPAEAQCDRCGLSKASCDAEKAASETDPEPFV